MHAATRAPMLLVCVLATACAACPGQREPGAAPLAAPEPRSLPMSDASLVRLRAAARSFAGTIEEVGPSPGVWSGILATFQPVVIRVEERFDAAAPVEVRGAGRPGAWPAPGERVTVWFGIVGPPDTLRTEPRLDPAAYRAGARGVLGADASAPLVGGEGAAEGPYLRAVTSFHEVAPGDPDGVLSRARGR